jgi:hypothetical protein
MIWREWGQSRARSLTVDRPAGGRELDAVDVARGGTRRDALAADEPVSFPLELIERLRMEGATPGACLRFDPLARGFERVEVRSRGAWSYEIVREDGTTAGTCEFVGVELRSFRCQAGGLVARRVDEAEYLARAPRTSVTIQRP